MPASLISKLSFVSDCSLKLRASKKEIETVSDEPDRQSAPTTSVCTLDDSSQSLVSNKQKQSFVLKEALLSLSGFYTIKDAETGDEIYKVKEKKLSLTSEKTIFDVDNEELYKLTAAKLSLRDKMTITDTSGSPVLTLRQKGLLPGLGKNTILAFPGGDDKGEPVFEIKGNFFKKDFQICTVENSECVAVVRRKILSVGSLLVGKDCYYVDVEPDQDYALILLCVVVLDQVFRDGSGVITGGGVLGLL